MATDPVRDEAERLVAAAIAALSVASRTLPGWGSRSGFATGSEECCVCPVCRAIAAMREPNPEFAERLATGAADLATGVASLLRSLSSPTGWPRPAEDEAPESPDPWHDATTEPGPPAKKPMAKKAVKKAAAKKAAETKAAETKAAETKAAETKAAETKAADTKAADTKAADTKAAETKAAEPKATPKKTPAKKVAKKTVRKPGEGG